MNAVLSAHAHRYPLMEPRDAVKLIYQNEFGGGHLIHDIVSCLEFLRREYDSVAQQPGLPLLEDIGNGMVRVNLAALDGAGLSVEALGTAFLCSAAISKGYLASFRRKLDILQQLTAAGAMPFTPDVLTAYLSDYEKAGFPMVSHSDVYRSAYHPSYRVVAKNCLPTQAL